MASTGANTPGKMFPSFGRRRGIDSCFRELVRYVWRGPHFLGRDYSGLGVIVSVFGVSNVAQDRTKKLLIIAALSDVVDIKRSLLLPGTP